ncbi:Fic family protein [Candidatus Curtissbacteria bacterium]|nr:Fic family protein [Candidatus Curtissbacteria bacterium]
MPAYEAKFRQEAVIRTVHHGTHIEGNRLDTGEVAAVLDGQEVSAKDRDVQEVLNYRNVLKYIDKSQRGQRSQKSQRIDEKDLQNIHKLTVEKVLPSEKAGKYRTTQVVVKNSKTGEISFRPPPANEVPRLVKEFFNWTGDGQFSETHPVLTAGITHYVLAYIHPFVDGNGRAARALATMVLFARGYDIKKFFSLEEYFDRNAKKYYQTLQAVSNQKADLSGKDLTVWLEYFCEGLAEELERVKERVRKLSLDSKLKGRTGQIVLSERQLALVEYIEKYGSISNKQWRSILRDYSDDTILRDMHDLQKKGLIKKKGSTKGAVYVLK